MTKSTDDDNVIALPARPVLEKPPAGGFDENASDLAAMIREISELKDEGTELTALSMDRLDALEAPEPDEETDATTTDDETDLPPPAAE